MTRINVLPPDKLTTKHLVAEYHELPRVFTLAIKAREKGIHTYKIPHHYCLGKGHVTFFYNKLQWLWKRYHALHKEMTGRGFKVNPDTFSNVCQKAEDFAGTMFWGNWQPDKYAASLNLHRLIEKDSMYKAYLLQLEIEYPTLGGA